MDALLQLGSYYNQSHTAYPLESVWEIILANLDRKIYETKTLQW